MMFRRTVPTRRKRGVPVRLPDGSTRDSFTQLARELDCQPSALYHHVIAHAGGYAVLGSLPDPARCGVNSPCYKGE